MLTIDALRRFGANVEEGVARCMGNEAFYLRMVAMATDDKYLKQIQAGFTAGNLEKAFEGAHGMKGVMANLAITPVLTPVAELSDSLKAHKDMDYAPLLAETEKKFLEFAALVNG
ncbi:MAG: hypothetical protein K5746_04990 [Clostridiales bacterium]|nr:hypothetical protein [Clostridiales bacterium]